MSKTPRNKKYLELEGIRVYYDKSDDSIQLIAADPDLKGKPFHITLNHGTDTERSIRYLLVQKGVISKEQFYPQDFIPLTAENPYLAENKPGHYSWDEVPIGVTVNSEPVIISLKASPHTLVSGGAGVGKTVLLNNFLLHALKSPQDWQIAGIDLAKVNLSPLAKRPESVYGLAYTIEDSVELLERLHETIIQCLEVMNVQNVSNFRDVAGEKLPAIMLVVEEALYLLSKTYGSTDETREWDKHVNRILHLLQDIGAFGRAAGVYIIMGTQRPDPQVFSTLLNSSFSNRVAVGRFTRDMSRLIVGTDAATQTLSKVGRALLMVDGKLTPFQIYAVSYKSWQDFPTN